MVNRLPIPDLLEALDTVGLGRVGERHVGKPHAAHVQPPDLHHGLAAGDPAVLHEDVDDVADLLHPGGDLLEIALLHKASLLARGDWGGLVYAFPALFIIPPIFGILSTVCTSRIILPHVIFAAVYFHAGMLSANPGFNTSSDDLIWQACVDIIRIMLHSLIPALIVYFIQ